MKIAEYNCECDYCDSETRVVVINESQEPEFCPMCGQEARHAFIDGEEDMDD